MSDMKTLPGDKSPRSFEGHGQVAVIVLGFNDAEWLPKCLSSLGATNYPDMIPIFVDNASSDESVELVQTQFPDVQIVQSSRNLGYAGGNNLGMRHAAEQGADYFVLLNTDTRVEPDWLGQVMEVFDADDRIGVVTASMRNYDDDTLDRNYQQILSVTPGFIDDAIRGDVRSWYETTTGSGAALAVSRRYIETVGAIDPVFFMYFEEIDWLRRGRLHGFKIAVSTQAIVHHFNHLEDPTERRPTKTRFERGHMIFTLKNQQEPLLKSLAKFLLEGPSRVTGALFAGQWKRAGSLLLITAELILRAPSIVSRRRRETYRPDSLPEMEWIRSAADGKESNARRNT